MADQRNQTVSESVSDDVHMLWKDVRGNGTPQKGLLWRVACLEAEIAATKEFHRQLARYVWLTGGTIILYVFQKAGAALWEVLKSHQLM